MTKKIAAIEAEMPFFLRRLGMLLELGLPFEQALLKSGEGPLKEEIWKIHEQINRGMGIQKALANFAAATPSIPVKRAVSQLISAYEIGSKGEELKKLGDELLELEQHRLKQHASKNAMFGLMFIISSAVLPTFFLVYAIIGRYAFNVDLNDLQITIIMLGVFPLLSALLLMISRASMPAVSFEKRRGFAAELLLPGAFFMLGFLLPAIQLLFLFLGIAVAAYLAYKNYKTDKKAEDIEAMLPDALFSVSGLPKSSKPERIFEIIEQGKFGALSEEATASKRQLSMNIKTEAVLDDLWQRNNSAMLKKTAEMMKLLMETNSLDRLDMLADDMLRHFQIKRERSQVFSLQKYTLLFGAMLVPLILKTTLNLLESMGTLIEDGSIEGPVSAAYSIVPPYLILYAIMCSAAIADAEGKKSLAAVYFIALAAASLITFYFISL